MEPASGIEPPTYGLRNRCSTTELRRLKTGYGENQGIVINLQPLLKGLLMGSFIPFATWYRQLHKKRYSIKKREWGILPLFHQNATFPFPLTWVERYPNFLSGVY